MTSIILRKAVAVVMIAIGIVLFMVEYKALPHKPKDPEKWDDIHKKYYRAIKMSSRIFLLLGLTFLIT